MKIPKGMTQEQVLDIVDRIVHRLKRRFVFGYYDEDDIRQEAVIIAMDGLERYDGVRPLENFLSVHIKNRLCNVKRKKYIRIDKPCLKCPFDAYIKKDDKCLKFECKKDCSYYAKWSDKNDRKLNIINPIEISQVVDDDEENMHDGLDTEAAIDNFNIISLIDNKISLENRENWLKLKNDVKINKAAYTSVKAEIEDILLEAGINVS